jgi:hypothetical protein
VRLRVVQLHSGVRLCTVELQSGVRLALHKHTVGPKSLLRS